MIAVSVLILTGMLGLLALWEQESLLFARSCRLRQARADVESAYTLYRLHPTFDGLLDVPGFLLRDSLPQSRVRITVTPWGLYEAVRVTTGDSLMRVCRLLGAEPDTVATLFYADDRSAVTLAGRTILKGRLNLPQNGLIYGRVGADFYSGPEIPQTAIRRSEKVLPPVDPAIAEQVAALFEESGIIPQSDIPDSLYRSFRDSGIRLRVGNAEIGSLTLRGNIILYADELRIGSSCCLEHLLICARKVTVAEGTRISAQIFARDTVIVEPEVRLEYPSGIYAQTYAQIGDKSEVNGYVIVRDTVSRKKPTPNYRQSRTARVRGLVWVDGTAQVQGIVCGQMYLRQAVYFSPQGYYKDLIYDATLLANPHTAHPLWLADTERRKEAVCAD